MTKTALDTGRGVARSPTFIVGLIISTLPAHAATFDEVLALACVHAELYDPDRAIANLKLGFERRETMLSGETFPDPREDDSFKRFIQNTKFRQALREMGYSAR